MMKDWYWKIVGKFALYAWDTAQRKGNVAALETLLHLQGAADRLFWMQIFARSLSTFLKENVDRVIDTQCLGTSAILRALRVYNRLRNKQVVLEKVVVDLPTEKNTHFFRSIKHLSKDSRKLIRPITIKPLLHEGQTPNSFGVKTVICPSAMSYMNILPFARPFENFREKSEKKEAIFHYQSVFTTRKRRSCFLHPSSGVFYALKYEIKKLRFRLVPKIG